VSALVVKDEGIFLGADVDPASSTALLSWTTPPAGTLEGWALAYLTASTLAAKFELAEAPEGAEENAPCRASARPQRPAPLVCAQFRRKTPGREALRSPARRAELMHTFLHHELQAAELFCWAILAFPDAPELFRRGLARIARDEVRHMTLYRDHLAHLGHAFGDFPVRDWFWERVPAAKSPVEFVATLGIGFEGGNLDHALRFAQWFRAVGDESGARLQERIFEEEISHVRFALVWFRKWAGSCDFHSWAAKLPPPLSPTLMKGRPIEQNGRRRAGFTDGFVAELTAWEPTPYGKDSR
jgi:uncharacterized ferritin-like protein (DUF455 family)